MTGSTGFKQELFDQFARIGKALSNGRRLEILEFLAQGEHNVETLANKCGMSVANTSQHLQALRQAGLVDSVKLKQHVYYRLSDDRAIELISALREIASKNLMSVQQLVSHNLAVMDTDVPISNDMLLQLMQDSAITLLDVRPASEFELGHIKGAINIPQEELESQLGQLDKNKKYVTYCRGPFCTLSYNAVAILRQSGYQACRLHDGYPEWKKSGLPIDGTNINERQQLTG
jgi:rhodanese-related sulfurtransferase/DNA-binding transcriptional ArsR family regulator